MELKKVKVHCYAKINLFLNVKRKVENYHQIESIFHTVSLYDELTIHKNNHEEPFRLIFLKGKKPFIPIETPKYSLIKENLLEKVFFFFQQKFHLPNITIKIKKNIPVGAGLGGGSSNAAGLILAINQLFELNVNLKDLQKIGKKFGSDIPFFFHGGLALIEGIGDKVLPLSFSLKKKLLLIYPNLYISTKTAYRDNCQLNDNDEYRKLKRKLLSFNQKKKLPFDDLEFLKKKIFTTMHNSFQQKTLEKKKIHQIFNMISEKTDYILLSGSGSSFFAFFNDIITMNSVYNNIKKKEDFIYKLELIDRGVELKLH